MWVCLRKGRNEAAQRILTAEAGRRRVILFNR